MTLKDAIQYIDSICQDKTKGLPEELFLFISRCTPLVNVDLIVRDDNGRILLVWRDDLYCGTGWHIPGGIVRYQETLEERVQKTALNELGTEVILSDSQPVSHGQGIYPELTNRGHYISFTYLCKVPANFEIDNKDLCETDVGFLKWFNTCPDNLLPMQENYKVYFKR